MAGDARGSIGDAGELLLRRHVNEAGETSDRAVAIREGGKFRERRGRVPGGDAA